MLNTTGIVWYENLMYSSDWVLELTAYKVGVTGFSSDKNKTRMGYNFTANVIIDSGSPLLMLPAEMADNILNNILLDKHWV